MKKPAVFDVLVVYTDGVATSASSENPLDTMPFSARSKHADYNDCYGYLLKICKKNKLKAGFTTTKDITESGYFNTHWLFKRDKWVKVKSACYAPLIFDKFSPINQKQRNLRISLFSHIAIKPFNANKISSIFFDKQKTYDALNKFTIPTVTLKNKSVRAISIAISELQEMIDKHPRKNDFSKKIVIKDRFGAGGNNIYCTKLNQRKEDIQKIAKDNGKVSFILQPFAEFEDAYGFKSNTGFNDTRVIYLGKKIIQAYIRTSAKDDFRCNTHQGGNIKYISKKEIPFKIKQMAKEILSVLDDNNSLFALDFIISNNGNPYLMEGNTGPGLNWSLSLNGDEKNTKKLIRKIVKELYSRVFPKTPNLVVPLSVALPIT